MGLLSSFIRSLDDLIAQGYPPEVAERIVSGDLPMDFESRMRRAEAMGFDPRDVQYHGTEADITQFRPSTRGKMGPGVYTTPSQSTANTFSGYPSPYAEGGNVMPLLLRGDYINRADAFDLRPEISGREGQRILNETLEGMGYSGSKAGERGSLAPEKVTFDPRNIRSYLSAAFDPEYKGSNILGATAGTAGALGLLAAPEDASAMESPSLRSALEEAGVIGDTLVPTKRPLGERAMGVVDRILTGLEVPQRGLQSLAATGYGLLSGEDFDTAVSRGADVVNQGVEESAREFGDYVFDLTGSPAAATAAYTTGILGSPL